jgi:hypothetical protein
VFDEDYTSFVEDQLVSTVDQSNESTEVNRNVAQLPSSSKRDMFRSGMLKTWNTSASTSSLASTSTCFGQANSLYESFDSLSFHTKTQPSSAQSLQVGVRQSLDGSDRNSIPRNTRGINAIINGLFDSTELGTTTDADFPAVHGTTGVLQTSSNASGQSGSLGDTRGDNSPKSTTQVPLSSCCSQPLLGHMINRQRRPRLVKHPSRVRIHSVERSESPETMPAKACRLRSVAARSTSPLDDMPEKVQWLTPQTDESPSLLSMPMGSQCLSPVTAPLMEQSQKQTVATLGPQPNCRNSQVQQQQQQCVASSARAGSGRKEHWMMFDSRSTPHPAGRYWMLDGF